MQPVLREYDPEIEMREDAGNCGDMPKGPTEHINEAKELSASTPPYAALTMPASRAALMVVLDENGDLVRVFTAADLLKRCRHFWRHAQD